jgi:hypothetical protein
MAGRRLVVLDERPLLVGDSLDPLVDSLRHHALALAHHDESVVGVDVAREFGVLVLGVDLLLHLD